MTDIIAERTKRIDAEIADSFDEELELELDDDRLQHLLDHQSDHPVQAVAERHAYFKELFRMQSELVKLQDWVISQKLKVVVIFEGRDARRKRRGDQAHHPASEPARVPGRGLARAQ